MKEPRSKHTRCNSCKKRKKKRHWCTTPRAVRLQCGCKWPPHWLRGSQSGSASVWRSPVEASNTRWQCRTAGRPPARVPASSPLCVFSMSLLVAPILSLLTSRTIVARGDKTCQCRLVSLKDLLLLTALGYLEQRSRKWEKRESKRRGQSMWEKQSGE